MKYPNPLSPSLMQPLERRSDLCRILALGLIRLRMRDGAQVSAQDREFPLHNSPDRSGHATPTKRRNA